MVRLTKLKNKLRERRNQRKWNKQRVASGYSDYDLWDMDTFLGDLIPRMLKEFADRTEGYPQSFHDKYGGKAFDEWIKYIYEMCYWFNEAQIENMDEENIFYDMFNEACDKERELGRADIKPDEEFLKEKDELFKRYCIESKRLYAYKQQCLKKGFNMLCEHFHDLWW